MCINSLGYINTIRLTAIQTDKQTDRQTRQLDRHTIMLYVEISEEKRKSINR